MITKTCNLCHKTKPIEEFVRDKDCKSGYSSRCKPCYAEYIRKRDRLGTRKTMNTRVEQIGKFEDERRELLSSGADITDLARRMREYGLVQMARMVEA